MLCCDTKTTERTMNGFQQSVKKRNIIIQKIRISGIEIESVKNIHGNINASFKIIEIKDRSSHQTNWHICLTTSWNITKDTVILQINFAAFIRNPKKIIAASISELALEQTKFSVLNIDRWVQTPLIK